MCTYDARCSIRFGVDVSGAQGGWGKFADRCIIGFNHSLVLASTLVSRHGVCVVHLKRYIQTTREDFEYDLFKSVSNLYFDIVAHSFSALSIACHF